LLRDSVPLFLKRRCDRIVGRQLHEPRRAERGGVRVHRRAAAPGGARAARAAPSAWRFLRILAHSLLPAPFCGIGGPVSTFGILYRKVLCSNLLLVQSTPPRSDLGGVLLD
jgi:hypothetical protein